MKELARLLNDMCEAGVIGNDALFGAVAQMRYAEPVATMDAGVLVVVPGKERLDALHPIDEYCATKGCYPKGEAIEVGAWPAQWLPVFSPLTKKPQRPHRPRPLSNSSPVSSF